MTDPISNEAARHLVESTAAQPKPEPIEIDLSDQSRFEDALNQTEAEPTETTEQPPEQPPAPADEDLTLGDAILDGIEKMKSSHDERAARIEQQLTETKDHDLSVQECVKLQFEVMQMGLEQELTGKIADKSSQGVQTLFKNQ